jgi:opacity protein-like surface antigen
MSAGCFSVGYRRASGDFAGVEDQFAFGVRMTGVTLDSDAAVHIDVGVEAANTTGDTDAWGQVSLKSADYHIGVLVPFINADVDLGFYDRFMAYFGFGASYVDVTADFGGGVDESSEAGGGYVAWGVYYMGAGGATARGALGLSLVYTMAPSLHLGNEYVEAGGMSVTLMFTIPEY